MKKTLWLYFMIWPLVTSCATAQQNQTPHPKNHANSVQPQNQVANHATTSLKTRDNQTDSASKPTQSTQTTHKTQQNDSLGIPEPKDIHGIYVSASSAANTTTFNSLVHMIDKSSLNTMVIDMKVDNGSITFSTDNPELARYSSNTIAHPKQMMQTLKQHHIYPIARIAVFEDTRFAKAHPQDSYLLNGHLWIGRQNQAYTNPFLPTVWKYNVDVAKQVAKLGFEQIQFDFVRFPAAFPNMENRLKYSMGPYANKTPTDIAKAKKAYQKKLKAYNASTANQSSQTNRAQNNSAQKAPTQKKSTQKKPQPPHFTKAQRLGGLRVDAVTNFVKYAKKELKADHVKVAVDIFGYTATISESTSVGQSYRRISKHVDVISPMIYPSLWGTRYFGISKPDLHPYQVVINFEKAAKKHLSGLASPPEQVPWIQDYTATFLGQGNYQVYSTAQVQAQIQALSDSGIHQYLIWNPNNVYSKGI